MKKHYFLLTFLIILLSCGGDRSSKMSSDIVGKWDLKNKKIGDHVVSLSTCEELYSSYEFKPNATSIFIKGDHLPQVSNCIFNQYNQTYTIENGILKIHESASSYEYEAHYKLLEVTPSSLVLQLYYSKEIENGVITTSNYTKSEQYTYYYEKDLRLKCDSLFFQRS
jgi:hypothetical protein